MTLNNLKILKFSQNILMHKEQVTLKELNTGRIIINYQFLLLLCAALTWLILHILGNYVYSSSKERDRVKKKVVFSQVISTVNCLTLRLY